MRTCWPPRRRRVLAVLAGWPGIAALGGCATHARPLPDAVLHDLLFGDPPRPAGADTILALSPPMHAHLQALRQRVQRPSEWPLALAESLYSPHGSGGLRLDYDASFTRNASQAFAARSGNCLSLVLMTTALAEGLGLEVGLREVHSPAIQRRAGPLVLLEGHVNVLLGPGAARRQWLEAWPLEGATSARHVLIDFQPAATAHAVRSVPLARPRLLAMFMNNRAVESLLAGQAAEAYAWAREALRTDPDHIEAFNTLGVVYQRSGHLAAAEAAYQAVLAADALDRSARDNLASLRAVPMP